MGSDRILLGGIRAVGRHGVLPEERRRAQPFEVDLEIEAALEGAGVRDDLTLTVDYGEVIATVVAVVEGGGYRLLEALATEIASRVLAYERVSAVTVEVRKPRPPVAADVASVGVRIRRSKE